MCPRGYIGYDPWIRTMPAACGSGRLVHRKHLHFLRDAERLDRSSTDDLQRGHKQRQISNGTVDTPNAVDITALAPITIQTTIDRCFMAPLSAAGPL